MPIAAGNGAVARGGLLPERTRNALAAAVLAFCLAGCSTTGRSFDTSQLGRVVAGQTTLEQAAAILKAEPENVYRQLDGSALARWAHKTTVMTDAVYLRRELWLQFGSDGRFQRVAESINVFAEPGQRDSSSSSSSSSSSMSPEGASSATVASDAAVPVAVSPAAVAPVTASSASASSSGGVDRSLPVPVPAGFPYGPAAFHGPTVVYPVR